MLLTRGIVVGLVSAALALTLANEASPASGNQVVASASEIQTLQQSGEVVWGKVPYCTCLATSATANVANALKDANLTVSLKELSPRDGWLYFVATYDSDSATLEQVSTAIMAGGGDVLEGPP